MIRSISSKDPKKAFTWFGAKLGVKINITLFSVLCALVGYQGERPWFIIHTFPRASWACMHAVILEDFSFHSGYGYMPIFFFYMVPWCWQICIFRRCCHSSVRGGRVHWVSFLLSWLDLIDDQATLWLLIEDQGWMVAIFCMLLPFMYISTGLATHSLDDESLRYQNRDYSIED